MPVRGAFPSWCSTAVPSPGRTAPRPGSKNYLGFPTGITGMALMGRAYTQAQKFGVEMAIPEESKKLTFLGSRGPSRAIKAIKKLST